MTKLRQRMIDDMQLYGLSERTQECYVTSVKKLAQYYMCSPDKLNQENIRRFFLYLIKEQKIASSTFTMYLSGIKFFYEKTLKQNWKILNSKELILGLKLDKCNKNTKHNIGYKQLLLLG